MKQNLHSKRTVSRGKALLCALLSAALLCGCAAQNPSDSSAPETTETPAQTETAASPSAPEFSPASSLTMADAAFEQEDTDGSFDAASAQPVTLSGDSIDFSGTGASVDGTTLRITKSGTYLLSGTLEEGSILIDADKDDTIRLIFSGVSISSSQTAPLCALGGKVILTLADGTENSLTDGRTALSEDDEDAPTAALYSKDDLSVNGGGALSITSALDGMTSRDTLRIAGGSITIEAGDDGVVGRDAFLMCGGTLSVSAASNGVKCSNDKSETKGFFALSGGSLSIVSGGDGVTAETAALMSGGTLTITAGGGSGDAASQKTGFSGFPGFSSQSGESDSSEESASTKGIKAGSHIAITGGTVTIDSLDDAIHSNGTILLEGGELTLSTGDDGVHADAALYQTGGQVSVAKSYEGFESALIVLSGGSAHVVSTDDGVNVAGGTDDTESAEDAETGRPQDPFGSMDGASGDSLYITGGAYYVSAAGDGVDVNGSAYLLGGLVLVDGPTDGGNGALDYDGVFEMYGGTLIAAGSSGMAQAPTGGSQRSLMMTFSSTQEAGTLVSLCDASGAAVLSYAPSKEFSTIVFSAPTLSEGTEYTLYCGGVSTGTLLNGFYDGGTYTPGDAVVSFPLDTIVTYVNESGVTENTGFGGFGGFGNFGGFGGGNRPGGGQPDGNFTPPEDGTRPEQPDGDAFPEGTPPELPDGAELPNGTPPELPDGAELPNGTPPERPGGASAPEGTPSSDGASSETGAPSGETPAPSVAQ